MREGETPRFIRRNCKQACDWGRAALRTVYRNQAGRSRNGPTHMALPHRKVSRPHSSHFTPTITGRSSSRSRLIHRLCFIIQAIMVCALRHTLGALHLHSSAAPLFVFPSFQANTLCPSIFNESAIWQMRRHNDKLVMSNHRCSESFSLALRCCRSASVSFSVSHSSEDPECPLPPPPAQVWNGGNTKSRFFF